MRRFQDKAKELTAKKERERENSKKTLGALGGLTLSIKKAMSDEGKLFGSVTTKELEAEFNKKGVQVDRRQIVLGSQIRMAGQYQILVKLVGGMKAMVALDIESDDPKKAAAMKALKEALAQAEIDRKIQDKAAEVAALAAAPVASCDRGRRRRQKLPLRPKLLLKKRKLRKRSPLKKKPTDLATLPSRMSKPLSERMAAFFLFQIFNAHRKIYFLLATALPRKLS